MPDSPLIHDLPLADWPTWARALFWVWAAFLGGAIGSFLNVVIYRTPRGMSLIHPGSRCPECGHAIRARDNLPVAGWLLLRGKCRDCGTSISARYPLVEALVAALFLALALLYVGTAGATLPAPPHAGGALSAWGERQLLGVCSLHLGLLVMLLAAAGMEYDRQRMPGWLAWGAIAVAGAAAGYWPWLRPFPGALGHADPIQEALNAGIVGGSVGWLVGAARRGAMSAMRRVRDAIAFDARRYVLVGVVLGWQSVLVVGLGVAACELLAALVGVLRRRRWPESAAVATAVLCLLPAGGGFSQFLATSRGKGALLGVAAFACTAIASWAACRLQAVSANVR